MKKVVVTGANGFVGTWLLKELSKHDIIIFAVVKNEKEDVANIENIRGCNVVYCDMQNISTLPKKITEEIDTFFHLAWMGSGGSARADYSMQLCNVKYACDAANIAKELGCKKFLCAGTITEKIAENILKLDVKAENTIYGIEKYNTHCLLDVVCKKLEMDYIWMQFSNVYGPYNNSGNIVNYTLNELNKGNIPKFSEGLQPYDLIYVEDLVYGIYLLGEKNITMGTYFIGSGSPRKLSEYLLAIKNEYGKNAKIELGARPDDGLKYCEEWFDITPLKEATGYNAKFTFEEGITKTIECLRR